MLKPNVLTPTYAKLVKTAALLLLFFGFFNSDEEIFSYNKKDNCRSHNSLVVQKVRKNHQQ